MRTTRSLNQRLVGQGALAFLFCLISMGRFALAEESIRVLVYGEHVGKNITYHYTFINNSADILHEFTIGSEFRAERGDDFPQLRKLPVGWKFGERGEVGTEILLDPAGTNQPYGWAPWAYGQQDIGYYYLQWSTKAETFPDAKGISPGETLSGFSVTVTAGIDRGVVGWRPRPEDFSGMYVNGGFRTYRWDKQASNAIDIRGKIEKQDTTPPVLSVSATPNILWPPNNKLVPVIVSVSVKDDYDRQPLVKLESITANEPLKPEDIVDARVGWNDFSFSLMASRNGGNKAGRIYTITYSATDGTGNKSTASTTVTVPHDQGK